MGQSEVDEEGIRVTQEEREEKEEVRERDRLGRGWVRGRGRKRDERAQYTDSDEAT